MSIEEIMRTYFFPFTAARDLLYFTREPFVIEKTDKSQGQLHSFESQDQDAVQKHKYNMRRIRVEVSKQHGVGHVEGWRYLRQLKRGCPGNAQLLVSLGLGLIFPVKLCNTGIIIHSFRITTTLYQTLFIRAITNILKLCIIHFLRLFHWQYCKWVTACLWSSSLGFPLLLLLHVSFSLLCQHR